MKRFLLGLCAIVLATGSARAQTATPTAAPSVDLKTMHEDIEIMRRLLVKELGVRQAAIYLPYLELGASMTAYYDTRLFNVPYPLSDVRDQSIAFEGNYLRGHGVAYTTSIPAAILVGLETPTKSIGLLSGCAKCHEPTAVRKRVELGTELAPKPLSDWDRTRQEVQGKKEVDRLFLRLKIQAQDICAPGTLTEAILKVLAENGHNFKQLAANENISVAITISGTLTGPYLPLIKVNTAHYFPIPGDPLAEIKDIIGVGDLHARQNKHAEAAKSYADAIKRLEAKPLILKSEAIAETANKLMEEAIHLLRQAYMKQAQALIGQNKVVEARAALDGATTATVKVSAKPEPKASVSAQPKSTPAKLLITVSKKSMEELHAGKIDMDQFRKLAEVQTVNLNVTDKK